MRFFATLVASLMFAGIVTAQVCSEEGAVRLVGGPTENEGRVEICVNLRWGSACGSYWDKREASVTCRQLGYDYAVAFPLYGRDESGQVHYFQCNGAETSLLSCKQHRVCSSPEHAGVMCSNAECNETDVRLVDDETPDEGWVEICLEGRWGSICVYGWDIREARVLCRPLGYNGSHIEPSPTTPSNASLAYLLYYISCYGTEQMLKDCIRYSSQLQYKVLTQNCQRADMEARVLCHKRECNETDVRLVNGETSEDGRVELCLYGVWGSVCDDGWDVRDATVVCRQLGFQGKSIPVHSHQSSSNISKHYVPIEVNCDGNEGSLSECDNTEINLNYCILEYEDAGVVCNVTSDNKCNETDVRLVDSETQGDGRVEICLNGFWGSVCYDYWDDTDARVVCRQLGYDGPSTVKQYYSYSIPTFYHLDDVGCVGNETALIQCEHNGIGVEDCLEGRDDAGVTCSYRECNETDVQLAGGKTTDDGRVEICLDGFWGPVCADRWDYRDADVVCRQLGYDGLSYPVLTYSGSSPRYSLDDVNCEGTEIRLNECTYEERINCVQGRAAGVICTNNTCVDGTLHLVGSDDISRGRVEYCYNGTWYSLCADGWEPTGNEANVVCKTLGYQQYYDASALMNYGRGRSSILPQSIRCSSGVNALQDCSATELDIGKCKRVAGADCKAPCVARGITNCKQCTDCYNWLYECYCHSECFESGRCCSDISATENCFGADCKHGSVNLVGGVTNSTGRLEFCAHGVWGRVCNKLDYWGPDNARVVCRQLGFSEQGSYILEYEPRFGESERDPVIGSVNCIGTEPELLDCFHTSIGEHLCGNYSGADDSDIIISCYDEMSGCEDGEVRLYGGTDPSNGRVEFCKDRRWIAVCSDGWGLNEAKIMCGLLNFDPEALIELPPSGPEFVFQVSCSGSEQYFNECMHEVPANGDCDNAAMSCGKSSNQPRCVSAGVPNPPHLGAYNSYGECSIYKSETVVCVGVRTFGIDSVYATSVLGDQSTIAALLDQHIRKVETTVISDHDEECVKQVFRVLCHFYLPPCGNTTHQAPPSSVCQEECQMVQDKCRATWDSVLLTLSDLDLILNCNDTSTLLFPVPHCCTGAGLGTPSRTTVTTVTPSKDDSGVGVGIGVLVFVLAATSIAIAVVLFVVLSKRRKQKRLHRMQQDILAMRGGNSMVLNDATVSTDAIAGEKRTTTDIDESGSRKGASELSATLPGASIADSNTYSEPVTKADQHAVSSMQAYELRARVPSHHMRELARGKFLVNRNDITLLDCIGEGEFGIVYKAKLRVSRKEVAVKTLKGDFDHVEVDMFVHESMKMSRFKHSHVMGLIGVCLDTGSAPYIIMPYMANGSLLKYLKNKRENVIVHGDTDEDEVREIQKRLMVICSQIASGMEYLAGEKYVHRDLAARNCMIDTHFLIKITDFGLSEDVFERNYFRQDNSSGEVIKLPIKWMAPESLSDGHFSEKSDVWSYGVTMWEIFSGGKAPYPGTDPLTLIQSLEQGHRMPPPYNTACSEIIYEVMMQCWKMSPEDRPTFKEIYSSVSKFIEHVAGYLEIGFNPFTAGGAVEGGGEGEEEEGEGEDKIDEEEASVTTTATSTLSIEDK